METQPLTTELDNHSRLAPQQAVIRLRETDEWRFDEQHRPYIRDVWAIYWVNYREVTHCCELTPSYYLRYITTTIDYTDELYNLPDDLQLRWKEEIEYVVRDAEADTWDIHDCYVHCRDIDRLQAIQVYHIQPNDYVNQPCDEIDSSDGWQNAVFDAVSEWYRGNPIW